MNGVLRTYGLAVIMAVPTWADAQHGTFTNRLVPGMRQMDRHNPFSHRYVDLTPGGFARRQAFGPVFSRTTFSQGGFFCGSGPVRFNCFDSCWDSSCFASPTSCWSFDCVSPSFACTPPVIQCPSQFGLGPVLNMLGAGMAVAGPPPMTVLITPRAQIASSLSQPRNASPEAVSRAARYLTAGDDHFAAQRYRDANVRYRTATETAPDLVEAFFRQGQALLATGQYELAGKAFKRGLRLGDKWPAARFDLVEMYGDNPLAKVSHLEAVANAAVDAPHDGTLLLLVALQLYFDGQQERSRPMLRKAAELLNEPGLNLEAGWSEGNRAI